MKAAQLTPAATPAQKNTSFFNKESEQGFFHPRAIGSRAVGSSINEQSFFSKVKNNNYGIQTKLTVGQPNDKYEVEADAMADRVVQRLAQPEVMTKREQVVQAKPLSNYFTPFVQKKCAHCEEEEKLQKKEKEDDKLLNGKLQKKPIFESNAQPPDDYSLSLGEGSGEAVQRKCAECLSAEASVKGDEKEEKLQKKSDTSTQTASSNIESSLNSSKGSGSSLPKNTLEQMGNSFGADFSNVRIHDDSSAVQMSKDLNAQAFTHGSDVYFNSGKYNTGSTAGKHLLAHELTHTLQQGHSLHQKAIQLSGSASAATGQKATTLQGPPFVVKGSKIDPSVDPKILNIGKISLPDFKHRNAGKFKTPLQTLQPRPEGTKQVKNWIAAVKSSANAKVGAKLAPLSKTSSGLYFLKSKKTDFRIFGTMKQIQEESYIPKWNRFGEPNLHQVDHILEMQLGGADDISNYELTDDRANTNSGNAIKNERERRVRLSLVSFREAGITNLPTVKQTSNEYIVSFYKIENWNLPYLGNGAAFWTRKEIEDGKHLDQLRPMTAAEIASSQGTDEELAIYVYQNSGRPHKIKLPFAGPVSNWLPGLDLVSLTTNPNAADGKTFGSIRIDLRQDFSDKLKSGEGFTILFNKTAGLINTGYLTFTKEQQALSGQLRFLGLSPLYIEQFGLDDKKGIILNGKIRTDIPILQGAEIDFSMEGKNYMLSKTFNLGEVKNFPAPFKVTDTSLMVFASSSKGLGVEGNLDFEISGVGKGQMTGMGSSKNGFGINGKFDFDPDLFKSRIEVSYINNEFSFKGSATLENEKLKGVKSLNIDVSYSQGTLLGSGRAKLSIPGVKEIKIEVVYDPNGKFAIQGDVEFGNIPKLKASEAKARAIISKKAQGWEIGIAGNLKPDINIAGLQIKEVNISYIRGIFDVSAKAHFGKGKINGDINAGVTNALISPEGTKSDSIGKELSFYADGVLRMEIAKNVEVELKVRINADGDLLIGGKLALKDDKYIIDAKEANSKTDKNLEIWSFKKSIPVASCGVASLVLGLKGGIGLFYIFDGLKVDKSTNLELEEVSLKDLSKANLKSDITISTGIKAGIDAYLGASAGLQVLIAGVRGEGTVNLRLTAIQAAAKANVKADFSAEKGLQFKEANLEFDVASKIAIEVVLGISVYLDLLFTDVTLWSHEWKPDSLKGEKTFNWFEGIMNVPLKFGDNNSLTIDNITEGLKAGIEPKAKNESVYERGANKGINEEGPTKEEKEEEAKQNIKKDIKAAYRGVHSDAVFSFNQTLDPVYFEQRAAAWYEIENLQDLNPKIKDLLRNEIIKYEFEEYEAFGEFLSNDTYFDAGTKLFLIEEFLKYRPTLGETETVNLKSLVTIDTQLNSKLSGKKLNKKKTPVQKKEKTNGTFHVSEDTEAELESRENRGEPLPRNIREGMGGEIGADFSNVYLHKDAEAGKLSEDLNAHAFTYGNNIYFNSGKFNPDTKEGQHLLAHELTHVVQQSDVNDTINLQRQPVETEAENAKLIAPLSDREWLQVRAWQERGEVATIDPLTGNPDENAALIADSIFCSRMILSTSFFSRKEDPLLCVIHEVTMTDPRVQQLLRQVTARGPIINWASVGGDQRVVHVMELLIDQYNFPVNGAAGLVGNLWSESGVLPNRIEGSSIGTPMKAPNSQGNTVDFTAEEVMNRDSTATQRPRSPGVGLAQWTSPNRRVGLFNHEFQSRILGADILFNMDAQVSYLVSELGNNYTGVYNTITAAAVSLNDASDEVVYRFEVPGSILQNRQLLPRDNSSVQAVFNARRNNGQRALKAYQNAHP
ncbi:MAG: phage tail tip lysozyme [Ginsengibacter sp.]